jgi:hypothetical protein
MTKSLENIQLFLDIQYRMFGKAVSINYDCFDLCNVLTAVDPRSEGYFVRISMVGFVLKGGKYPQRYLH